MTPLNVATAGNGRTEPTSSLVTVEPLVSAGTATVPLLFMSSSVVVESKSAGPLPATELPRMVPVFEPTVHLRTT